MLYVALSVGAIADNGKVFAKVGNLKQNYNEKTKKTINAKA